VNCTIALPHGERVQGHFNPNPKNPNITGAELRRWIVATVPRRGSVGVIVAETNAALLQLQRKLRAESNPTRRDALANQGAALDSEIDQCVYRLYSLTSTEIAAVERVVEELVAPP
jgi:hypothetical protein